MTSLSLIYLMAFVLGIAETLADTAGSSILPAIVEPEKLEQANAWLVGAVTVTNEFIGPPLGGALAAVGLVLAFGASSALYLVAVVCLLMIAGSFRPKRAVNARLREELVVGLRFVWHDGLLRTLAIIVAVMNFGWSAWAAVMVVYVVKPGPGGLSEFGYGLMLTSIGIGGAIGALVAVPLVTRLGRRWAIGADIVGTFLMLAMPAVTANAWAIGAVAILGGIGGSMWSIVVSSIRQQIVPDDMLGRTSGVFRLFGYGSLPIGAAVAGIIAEGVGLQAVFAFCAILTALLIFPFMRNIVPADLDQRQTTPSV